MNTLIEPPIEPITEPMKHIVFVDSTSTGLLALNSARELGCYITFVKPLDSSFFDIAIKDQAKAQQYYDFVDQYIEIDSLDEQVIHPALVAANAKRPIDAIITTSEAALSAVAREAAFFGTVYPDPELLQTAIFKNNCRQALSDAGVRSTAFETISETALLAGGKPQKVSVPFVIKPIRGFGKEFSAVCLSQDDFTGFVERLAADRAKDAMIDHLVSHEYIVEEYINGDMYSIEIIVQQGIVSCFATTGRERSKFNEMVEVGTTIPCQLTGTDKDEMLQYVQDIITALKLDVGCYHIEIMRDKQGPCLIEVNGRMIGAIAPRVYQAVTDIDPYKMLIRLHLGEKIDIDDSVIKGAATSVAVGARAKGTVSMDFTNHKLDQLLSRYEVVFNSLELHPGKEVNFHTGNFKSLGYVMTKADTPLASIQKAYRFVGELETLIGVELDIFNEPV